MNAGGARTVVVTGASSGLGLEAARGLAAAGDHVILAVRNPDRGARAASQIVGSTEVRRLDVADLASVRDFAASLGPFDVLVNNAGVMGVPEARTADGVELQLATNHLGHFALTLLVLDRLLDRVVVVGSEAHRHARLAATDLNFEREPYSPYQAYARSKLANLLFMAELQRRLTAAGSTLRALAAHPGYTSTKLMRSTDNRFFNTLAAIGNKTVGMTPAAGARLLVAAATLDLPGNTYLGPDGFRELRGAPVPVARSAAAGDPDLAKEVWRQSERLSGTAWPFGEPRLS